MPSVPEYRELAADASLWAGRAPTEEFRRILLDIATTWRRAAQEGGEAAAWIGDDIPLQPETLPVVLMTDSLECRRQARECVRLAREGATPRKTALVNMARGWLVLAKQMDAMSRLPARD